jgi:hypothetical protein
MSELKLKPCPNPWCCAYNSRTIRSKQYGHDHQLFWVRCSCGVCGPIAVNSRPDAIAAWNTRTDPMRQRLVDALMNVRLHLADYSNRSMYGTECDNDVKKAQAAIDAVLSDIAKENHG